MLRPMLAVLDGAIAGVLGSAAQDLFFRATSKIAPESPKDVFHPPEARQKEESQTQTVARRAFEGLAKRPLRDKELAGRIVHYAFGGAWGIGYGLFAGSSRRRPGVLSMLAFSTIVWGIGDNLVLPVFRVAAWPQKYPARVHAYAWAAHVAYGAAVWLGFEALRDGAPRLAVFGLGRLARRRPRVAARALRIAPVRRALARAALERALSV